MILQEAAANSATTKARKEKLKGQIAIALSELGEIGEYCGTRYRQDLPKVYRCYLEEYVVDPSVRVVVGTEPHQEGKEKVFKAVYEMKSAILQAVFARVSPDSNVHTLSGFMKAMKNGLGLPDNVDGGDPLAKWPFGFDRAVSRPEEIARLMQEQGFRAHALVQMTKDMIEEFPFGNSDVNPFQEALVELYANEQVKGMEAGDASDKAYRAALSEGTGEVFEFDEETFMSVLKENSKGQDCGVIKPEWVEKLLIEWGVLEA